MGQVSLRGIRKSCEHAHVDAGQQLGLAPDAKWTLGFGVDGRLAA